MVVLVSSSEGGEVVAVVSSSGGVEGLVAQHYNGVWVYASKVVPDV